MKFMGGVQNISKSFPCTENEKSQDERTLFHIRPQEVGVNDLRGLQENTPFALILSVHTMRNIMFRCGSETAGIEMIFY